METKLLITLGVLNATLAESKLKFKGKFLANNLSKEIDRYFKEVDKQAQSTIGKEAADEGLAAINEYTLIFDYILEVMLGIKENDKLKKAIEENLNE